VTKMQRELSIVGVVLNGKENYLEWSRKIEHTLIFNDLSDDIFDGDTKSTKPTTYKELAIWMNKDKKSYALIVASVNEEVSYHIRSIKDSWSALKKLKDPYDSHSKLELIQLLMKLFNLEMKDNDPMALAYEIKAIMHDVYVDDCSSDRYFRTGLVSDVWKSSKGPFMNFGNSL
jgi:hypothetical protein